MRAKYNYEFHNRPKIWRRGVALLMCVVLALSMANMAFSTMATDSDDETPVYGVDPLFNGTLNLDRIVSKDKLDKSMHLIIRHWHTEQNPDPRVTVKNEVDKTVIVGIYIVPQDDDYTEFKYYARAYTRSQENNIKKNKGHYLEIRREDQTGDPNNRFSRYIRLENDGTVSIFAWPFVDTNGVYYEHFAGFSVSAGQTAVTVEDGTPEKYYADARLIINPTMVSKVALVKSHLFYVSEMESVNGEMQQGDRGDFEDYIDTSTYATKKYYNASAGLHTDKTAGISTNTKYNDDRTFDLDLESWYNNGDPVDVGMILDASGSMGFTANTPNPINVLYDSEGNYNPFGLSEETLAKRDSSVELKNAFLTDQELAMIVNPRKTDNSKIRGSGYSYFIYDPRSETKEFIPLGYWDGGLPKAETLIGYYNFDNNALTNGVSGKSATMLKQLTSDSNISFGATTTTEPTVTDGKLIIGSSSPAVGLLLDAKPTDGNFTISFSINKSGSDAASNVNQKSADVLYVGALAPTNNHYFRAIRESRPTNNANSGPFGSVRRAWFTGYQGNPSTSASLPNDTVSATSVFHDSNIHVVTYVFKNGKLTSYFDGTEKLNITNNTGDIAQTKNLNVDDYNIILNGFNNGYNGANIQIDDIYVFDDALTDTQIRNFADIKNYANSSGSPNYPVGKKTGISSTNDIIPALDTDGNVLGTVIPDFVAKNPYERAGWYYINPSGNWDTNYFAETIQSGKTLNGILPNNDFNDILPDSRPRTGVTAKNTNRMYTSSGAPTPVKFYIGANGYLRCLYYIKDGGIDNGRGASFVYQNNDQDYIKVEALQRALGSFITGLEARSPESMVSAVRFSTDKIPDSELDKLVVLDWTADVKSAQLVLSGQRGDGGTIIGTNSYPSDFTELTGLDGIEQYNYGLTGGTSTLRGLNSFWQNLAKRLDPDIAKIDKDQYYDPSQADVTGKKSTKYVIIFTDGKDTDLKENKIESTEAYKLSKKLKKAGYTIFCILLAGGPVKYGAPDYQRAEDFLKALSGPGVGNKELEKYVYSTEDPEIRFPNGVPDDYDPGAPDYSTGMSNVDALVSCFTGANGILDEISEDLTDYNVQDYIDPRFDLVDKDGNVWHLNANGNVVVRDKAGKIVATYTLSDSASKTQNIDLFNNEELLDSNLKNKLTKEASQAALHYDNAQNMYYLVWMKQTIPGSSVGGSKIRTWHGKVTVRAKDDFIGGNAILSNGNAAKENYVYYPDDAKASSGIGNANLTTKQHPSKGFPRTTVNVPQIHSCSADNLYIYMGQNLATSVVKSLIEKSKDNGDYATAYYWDYIERYVNYYNAHPEYQELLKPQFVDKNKDGKVPTLDDLMVDGKMSYEKLSEILFASYDEMRLPYSYLPDAEFSNQTGEKEHETDIIGYITYSSDMESEIEDGPIYKEGAEAKDTVGRKVGMSAGYAPLDSCTCENCEDCSNCTDCACHQYSDRSNALSNLITDTDYAWDKTYKETVGGIVDEETIAGNHEAAIVSGEIAMQVELPGEVIFALKKKGISMLIYSANLMRDYPGAEPLVCTFTAYINVDSFNLTSINDTFVVTVDSITYNSAYDYVWNNEYGNDQKGNMGGLPIGTYTLEPVNNDSSIIKFNSPVVIDNTDGEYGKNGNFVFNIEGQGEWGDYLASLGEGSIGLGKAYEGMADYTNARFGIFRVGANPPTGDLVINKRIDSGKEIDTDLLFNFDATLTYPEDLFDPLPDKLTFPCSGDGIPSNSKLTFIREGNTYTTSLQLRHGESIKISDIPSGIDYTVSEVNIPDEYELKSSSNTGGVIPIDDVVNATFVNKLPSCGNLKISKTVEGENPDDAQFTFNVNLTLPKGKKMPDTGSVNFTKVEGTENTYTATIYLKHGQSVEIKDLPAGTVYVVSEINIPDGFTLKSSTRSSGSIPEEDTANAVFVNTSEKIKSQIMVTKQVLIDPIKKTNNLPDLDKIEFDFEITIEDFANKSISATVVKYNSDTKAWDETTETVQLNFDKNGTASFKLTDEKGLLIKDELKPETKYSVSEILSKDQNDFVFCSAANEDGDQSVETREDGNKKYFTVSGETEEEKTSEAHYFNKYKQDFDIPTTGGNIKEIAGILFAGAILMLSGTVFIFLSFKKKRASK